MLAPTFLLGPAVPSPQFSSFQNSHWCYPVRNVMKISIFFDEEDGKFSS